MIGYYITKAYYQKTKDETGKFVDSIAFDATNDTGLYRHIAVRIQDRTAKEISEEINEIIGIFKFFTPEMDKKVRSNKNNRS